MKRSWTIIGVANVAHSFNWYQSLFGHPKSAPAHHDFGQLVDTDGTVLLCLHQWGAHDHPTLGSPEHAIPGNGLLLFFRVDDFDDALERARGLVAELEEDPRINPATGTREFAVRDPDGYYVWSARSPEPARAPAPSRAEVLRVDRRVGHLSPARFRRGSLTWRIEAAARRWQDDRTGKVEWLS